MVPASSLVTSTVLAWSRIDVRGPQAEEFLQGQLTQDVAEVDHAGRWSLLLRPDSAVICAGWLARDRDGFTFDVPRSLGDVALARLTRFHLRVDCTLTLADVASGPYNTAEELVTARWPGPNECAAELSPQSYGATIVGETVSFTKGCYTGQELVARLDARGASVPWRFVHCAGPNRERIDEVLASKGPAGPQGLTTAVDVSGTVVGLGFAHRTLLAGDHAAAPDVTVESID
jgi:folate-binding protein YgfZ